MQNISGANEFPYALHTQNLMWSLNLIHTNSGKMPINFDVHISYSQGHARLLKGAFKAGCTADLSDNVAGQLQNAINCRKWLAQ